MPNLVDRTIPTLREAANAMREQHPASHPRHEMWFTLAAFLDDESKKNIPMPAAVKVAEAYLAAVDRPDIDGGI
jgi:hypothetical protein